MGQHTYNRETRAKTRSWSISHTSTLSTPSLIVIRALQQVKVRQADEQLIIFAIPVVLSHNKIVWPSLEAMYMKKDSHGSEEKCEHLSGPIDCKSPALGNNFYLIKIN